ncbi:Transcriptional activator FeaR [Nocardia sp. RB20]|uniref:Transcriptional activator FeaR n=2 Tax=Nocardia macrotermitis TaxID=2585198 RepID=A0A7K0DHB5_9NOCA|nr:Transcriptional activator FeaR [Nocardia macrotermitis]
MPAAVLGRRRWPANRTSRCRTLHRAFAQLEESVAAYIRRRRLEQARLDLTTSRGRPNVAEVGARWHFADSSHFIRAFKKQYGETPAQFARRN